MKAALVLLAGIFFATMSAQAARSARDNFVPIDDKNYYEFLGVQPTSSKEDIKSAYRELIVQHHPDRIGEAMAKKINEAYGVLRDPEKRRRYDRWLGIASAGNSGGSAQMDEEEDIDNQIRATADFIFKEAGKKRAQNPHATFADMAFEGRFYVVYYVRWMPTASYRGEDLYRFIWDEGIKAFELGNISADALAMLAGGALTYLTERGRYDLNGGDYSTSLERVKRVLQVRLQGYQYDLHKRQIYDDLWKITSNGESFYQPPPPPQAQSANSCEGLVTAKVTKDGVTYEIPIRVSIKIGF